jgi:hypothetical protein
MVSLAVERVCHPCGFSVAPLWSLDTLDRFNLIDRNQRVCAGVVGAVDLPHADRLQLSYAVF